MLTLNNLTCSKGGKTLFKDLSFTVGDCCLLVVRGGNGSGKTSLLNIIACLARADSGEILYANEKVTGEHWQEYCEIINYVGHKNAIKPYLTVRENLEFWASLTNSKEAVDSAISFFDLTPYENTPCANLSIGWQKKVSLAKLLSCRSEIWLLDEPFANLDEDSKLKMASVIQTRCQQGGSVILTAHGDIPLDDYVEINIEEFKGV